MKGVVMTAGKGTRLFPFTENISKCMLPIAGRPILQYSLEHMERLGISDICIVVRAEFRAQIESHFGNKFGSSNITYIEQDMSRKGTAAAVLSAKQFIGKEDALIIAGDILAEYADVKQLYDFHMRNRMSAGMLLKEVNNPKMYGIAVLEGTKVVDIIEKPENPKSSLANTSVYVAGPRFIAELEKVSASKRGEYEITSALYALSGESMLYGIKAEGYWNDVGTPWSLLEANEHYMREMKGDVKGRVEASVLKGNVVVEEGAEVINSYIEGPCYICKGAKIGPFAYIKGSTYLGPNVEIGAFTNVKNSIILEKSKAKHLAYIGDSLVGRNCNFGSSTQLANLRFDRKTVKMNINGTAQDSGRRKLGAVIGPNVNFGVNSIVLPGKKIGGHSIVGPSAIVYEDIPPKTRLLARQDQSRTAITER